MTSYAYSNWRNGGVDHGPRAKCDQVVYEAIAKGLEIVVHSRSSSNLSSNAATASASNASSRFNLHVNEIPAVRTIVSRWRHSLHVPIRVDVYFQHETDASRRELLERWCVEYIPTTMERFRTREPGVPSDPIVQLRHVCKRIVIWLRTLHCWSRLLPSQAFRVGGSNQIGFSVYVVSDDQDDIGSLVEQQGFLVRQNTATIATPYGELGWQVAYAPEEVVSRLLPAQVTRNLSISPRIPRVVSASRSIPIHRGGAESRICDDAHHHYSTTVDTGIPQSAPAHLAMEDNYWENQQRPASVRQNTYDPSRLHQYHRAHTEMDDTPRRTQNHGLLERRHTTVGQEYDVATKTDYGNIYSVDDENDKKPARVLSGLSLALLVDDAVRSEENPEKEKRRAALHQMPPHVLEQQSHSQPPKPAAHRAQGEYGYGYNNHIAWQAIHPSSTHPTAGRSLNRSPSSDLEARSLSTSPARLGSTPPGAAFIGSVGTTATKNMQHLIAPRNSSARNDIAVGTAVTPPFASRPAGFAHEPAPMAALTEQANSVVEAIPKNHNDVLPPLSLDLLHSSPFQQPQGSLISSLGGLPDSALHGSTDLRRSLWNPSSHHPMLPSSSSGYDITDPDEMPFAVDLPFHNPNGASTKNPGGFESSGNGNSLSASAAIASFAHQRRLQLFDSCTGRSANVDDLTSQLAELRDFGASISVGVGGPTSSAHGSEHDAASTTTPISLQT
ncbi:predicted protein [Phaeodactylum tricornutum CCAP 1055/1]|uniref:Autophagy-related protein 13 N-terminal domain-containing protein n=1 Tax=Phaeodactylum tricornutum (strain CCAP 1055/1) TaxID=556484 RepID=B7S4H9_PHATC|nr:predicted protein [Phaeodactylum tricornutum CCAP 1055/1]EEC42546.1 predicted protein [Phaeodactylum tricornutum CCAP 1055/1]|eukprot:XP_002176466.1 predicted protein [Phaeodactylum tricornutum CCAP 1055/1]